MHHSLVEATKLLLQAALQEPLNNRFVLMSETHVPLYPPGLVYLQLQNEALSRMDGCHFWPLRIKVGGGLKTSVSTSPRTCRTAWIAGARACANASTGAKPFSGSA